MEKYFGKYRGKVANNVDPMQLGRIQVTAPSILGDGRLSWAMPCVPFAGKGVGFFAIPPVGANVWVEFEGGNLDSPIWSGCFWGVGEVPAKPAVEQIKMFKTQSISLTMSDLPGAGGVKLDVNPPGVSMPLKLVLNSSGIEINSNPANIKLTAKGIDIKMGAANVKMSPAKIEVMAPQKVEVTGAEVKTASSGGSAVKLMGPKADINNGALEVM